MVPQRNGIAAARRKGAYPLGRSGATQTTWEDAMSESSSGSSAVRTNTLRQERIEVRRSSVPRWRSKRITLLVTDPLLGKDQAIPGSSQIPATVHL